MLATCPECQRDVSTKAKVCPGCGFPIRTNGSRLINSKIYNALKIIALSVLFTVMCFLDRMLIWPLLISILSYQVIKHILKKHNYFARAGVALRVGHVVWIGLGILFVGSSGENFIAFLIFGGLILGYLIKKQEIYAIMSIALGTLYGVFYIYSLFGMGVFPNSHFKDDLIFASVAHAALYLVSSALLGIALIYRSNTAHEDSDLRVSPYLEP